MTRTILGWLIFVLIASFIGFVAWLFFFREEPTVPQFEAVERPEDFFPVDTTSNIGENGVVDQGDRSEGTSGRSLIPRVRQLSNVPTAAGIVFERNVGTSDTFITEDGVEETTERTISIFRYIERATGHLYETRENTLTQTRLSNTTIPKVYGAEFDPTGEHAVLQLIDESDETVKTITATVTAKSTTTQESYQIIADGYALEGPFLAPNIESIEISEEGITYAVPNTDRGSAIIAADFRDLAKNLLYDAPLVSWIIQDVNEDTIAITTKGDSSVDGFMYLINKNNKAVSKVLGDIPGLTTLMSPSGKWILYAQSSGNSIDTYALNRESGDITTLGIKTLPEKCAFSNTNEDIVYCGASNQPERGFPYPESWYQGLVSFNDNLWRAYLDTNEYDQILGDGEEVDESFDITQIVISPKDEYAVFINKKDLTLWSVELNSIER